MATHSSILAWRIPFWPGEFHDLHSQWGHKELDMTEQMSLCRSQQTVENSSRDGNTRPPDLPPGKSVCRSRRNRIGHGTIDWFQIGKGVRQDCILSPWVFNSYAEYII